MRERVDAEKIGVNHTTKLDLTLQRAQARERTDAPRCCGTLYYLYCPLMCGFKRKQATFLVGRCAHSTLTHSHSLTHSLTHSYGLLSFTHSSLTHSLRCAHACRQHVRGSAWSPWLRVCDMVV